jgi:hypothetical protein
LAKVFHDFTYGSYPVETWAVSSHCQSYEAVSRK